MTKGTKAMTYLTVEVNMEPVREQGHVLQVLTKSEISLPKLANSYIQCFTDKNMNQMQLFLDLKAWKPTKISRNK